MKTLKQLTAVILVVACICVCDKGAKAQGTVDFGNSTQLFYTNAIDNTPLGKIQAGQFAFGLYFGITMNAVQASITPVLTVTNGGFPGFITTATFTLNGFNTGDTYFYQVRAWQAGTGNTYETSTGLIGGVSSIGKVTLGGGTVAAGKIFFVNAQTTPDAIMVFPLPYPVPEPSTVSMFSAGVGALIGGWRFKKGVTGERQRRKLI